MNPLRIQLWTGSMGGHARIAQAIAWSLTEAEPDTHIHIVDIYSAPYVYRGFAAPSNAYDRFVARAPWLWGAAFYASPPRPGMSLARRVGTRPAPRQPPATPVGGGAPPA